METRARQLGHMTARMVCGFICVLLMSRFMFYCGFTCVLFMMSFRCVYDSLVFAFILRLRCFMLVLYVFGLCKALSLRSGSYRRSPLGLPKTWVKNIHQGVLWFSCCGPFNWCLEFWGCWMKIRKSHQEVPRTSRTLQDILHPPRLPLEAQ